MLAEELPRCEKSYIIILQVLLYKLALQTNEHYGAYIIQLYPVNIYSILTTTHLNIIKTRFIALDRARWWKRHQSHQPL
jgi:hypothetical protein